MCMTVLEAQGYTIYIGSLNWCLCKYEHGPNHVCIAHHNSFVHVDAYTNTDLKTVNPFQSMVARSVSTARKC